MYIHIYIYINIHTYVAAPRRAPSVHPCVCVCVQVRKENPRTGFPFLLSYNQSYGFLPRIPLSKSNHTKYSLYPS